MRGATECARRLKRLFASLRSKLGKVHRPHVGDPITQMILGIFSRDMPESKAREALDRLRGMVVDYNELRVIAATELAEGLDGYPDIRLKAEDLSRSLNKVFAIEHVVSLDRLKDLPAKDARDYLERLDGLEAYTRARIRLLGLQQHAIPLDEAMWAFARKTRIVSKNCSLENAERFLERQISENDALEFVALLRKQAWADMGSAVRKGEFEKIKSIPPDRSSRNMLQLVVSSPNASTLPDAELKPSEPPEPVPAEPKKPAQPKRTARKGAPPKRSKASRSTPTRKKRAGGSRKTATRAKRKRPRKSNASNTRGRKTTRGDSAKRARKPSAKAKSA